MFSIHRSSHILVPLTAYMGLTSFLCQVEMVGKDGSIIPVSLWLRRLQMDDRCLAVAEPVERRVARVSFKNLLLLKEVFRESFLTNFHILIEERLVHMYIHVPFLFFHAVSWKWIHMVVYCGWIRMHPSCFNIQ